ncbi:MAG: carboxypeptidase-like regulatory domain-containing protein [Pyrinomonadaceae bacterium]
MRIGNYIISIVFALLLLSGVAAAQDGVNAITVEVKGEAGRPLKSACVTLVPREGEIVFRKADAKGQVKVRKLTPGSYRVIVKVDGYEAQKREVTLGGSSVETVAFLMQPRGR